MNDDRITSENEAVKTENNQEAVKTENNNNSTSNKVSNNLNPYIEESHMEKC